MNDSLQIAKKINEVKEEMKRANIWKKETPAWVKDFEKRAIANSEDFSEWLQFVYLPNRMQEAENSQRIIEKIYIVPQVKKFFGDDLQKGKLLQLLIELDALS